MYAFDAFELDAVRFELRRAGERVHIEPQVFDLLRYLVEHRDRVVSKDEILTAIWGGKFVSEAALTSRIKMLRRAIDDDGDRQQQVRTIRQRGYQFIGAVREIEAPAAVPPPREPLESRRPTQTAAGPQPAPRPADQPATTQRVGFCRGEDGVRIAYARTGSGPPLVKAANWMTHLGYDLQSPVWRHWLAAFSERHELIRYDERGCGLSAWDIPDFGFDSWVRDLELVVDAVGLETFPLLGVSQGAAVAIEYAVRHPERVERLVLIGGYACGRAVRATTDEERRAAALDLELARVGWGRHDPAFRRVFAMQFLPDGSQKNWDDFDELQRRTTSAANAVRFLETFAGIDIRSRAPLVDVPTLILHSREDHRVPFSCAGELAELIPDSRVVPLPSRNHLLTEPEFGWAVLVDEVERFLAPDVVQLISR